MYCGNEIKENGLTIADASMLKNVERNDGANKKSFTKANICGWNERQVSKRQDIQIRETPHDSLQQSSTSNLILRQMP